MNGPVPSGWRLICRPHLSTHSLATTSVNDMAMAPMKAMSGLERWMTTVYLSGVVKPAISLALPAMKASAPTTPV